MTKKTISSMFAIVFAFSNISFAETDAKSGQRSDRLTLQGENESERYHAAQATDSNTAALAAIASTQFQGAYKGWDISMGPYAWLAGMDVTSTINGVATDVDLSFTDILDEFDEVIAFSTHMEAWKEQWGIMFDLGYIGLETEVNVPMLDIDVEIEDFQILLGGAYRLVDRDAGADGEKALTVDALAGLRYHYLKQELELTAMATTKLGGSEDWVEPYIGSRFMLDLNEKWSVGARGDIGGFGIGSASDLTWQVLAGFEYRFNQKVAGQFGYKYFDIDYSRGSGMSEFGLDGNMDGVYLALFFNW